MLALLKRTVFACALGVIATLFIIQNDAWVESVVLSTYQQVFQRALGCDFHAQLHQCTIFHPRLELKNVLVCDNINTPSWYWKADHFSTGFSWFDLLLYGTIEMWFSADGMHIYTSASGTTPAISEHIAQLTKRTPFLLPLSLKTVTISRASYHLELPDYALTARGEWKCSNKRIHEQTKFHVEGCNGTIFHHHNIVAQQIKTDAQISNIESADGGQFVIHLNSSALYTSNGTQQQCTIQGAWQRDSGEFSFSTEDGSCILNPVTIFRKHNHVWFKTRGTVHAHFLESLCTQKADPSTKGIITFSARGTVDDLHYIDAQCNFKDVCFKQYCENGSGNMVLHKRTDQWKGAGDLHLMQGHWNAQLSFDQTTGHATVDASNKTEIAIPHSSWSVKAHSCLIKGSYTPEHSLLEIQSPLTNISKQLAIDAHATIRHTPEDTRVDAQVGAYHLKAHAQSKAPTWITSATLVSPDYTAPLFSCATDPHHPSLLRATVQFPLIQAVLKESMLYELAGSGTLHLVFTQHATHLDAHCHFADGSVRLGPTYNFVRDAQLTGRYDWQTGSLIVRDVHCMLHTGSIHINRATAFFDERGNCSFLYCPTLLEHCLFHAQKDFFAMISAAVSLQYVRGFPCAVGGSLIIDRAQLKKNIFSEIMQTKGSSAPHVPPWLLDSTCSLVLSTKDAIRIDTPFLQAHARAELNIGNIFRSPSISGNIILPSGKLLFPYKPLLINKATITFVPHAPESPFIQLRAQNSIKKHTIKLQAGGSVSDHHVFLESSPPLSQEQIIALLFTGSYEQSLNLVMPALITQNLKTLILGTHKPAMLEQYFKPINRPFHINLIPSFSDQSGRGGLRGALEIDIDERWHAVLQHNFSLSEDTRVEIEYQPADDVYIRAVRDERRSIGAEFEMRWKF